MKQSIIMCGGLGNQMFQYAMLLSMQAKGRMVKKNTTLYTSSRMHNGYMLDEAFGISDNSKSYLHNIGVLWTRLIRSNRIPFLLYREDENHFCPDVYCTIKPYIDGYWINEDYFRSIKDDIRKTFIFRGIDARNDSIAKQMQKCSSVSLHIRRGDYLNNPMYAVCDELYYERAIEYIKKMTVAPLFYVFSDDPEWSRIFMKRINADYIIMDHNVGRESYKDMFLMSQCKHNIIANSTFSWWGAWLNNNKEKIVVCPNIWINGRTFNPCMKDWYHI